MIGFGAWTIPAAYYSERKQHISSTDRRFKILHSIQYYTTNYFEVFGDWLIDMPERPDQWFTANIIANWKKYDLLIRGDYAKTPEYKSQQSDKHGIPGHLIIQVTSFGHTLKTKKWISLENFGENFSCAEVIGMDPGEFNQGTNGVLRRYLRTLKLHYTSNADFITALDLMHYDREHIENWKNILQFVRASHPDVSQESKEFIDFYNKLLIKLYDFYEWSLPANDKTVIRQLSQLNFLCQDEQTGVLDWKPASKIFYLDDKPAYELLPPHVKEIVQPHFTNRDRNRFGQIARVVGISFKKAIKQELEDEPVLRELSLYEFFPNLSECLALAEFYLNINLDRELEKIRQVVVKEKRKVIVTLYRNNVFLEKLALPHKVVDGKIAELHIIPKGSQNGPEYFANCLHDLLVEFLNRDLARLQNVVTDFLLRPDKDRFLTIYDVNPDRVREIREKLADRIYTNEQLFWNALLQTAGISNPEGYFEEDEIYFDDLEALFKTDNGQLSLLAGQIDFDRLHDSKNLVYLQDLFRLVNIDPLDFNKHAVSGLDFTEHFTRTLKGLQSKYKPILQKKLFNYLLTKKAEKQSEFQDLMDFYSNHLIYNGLKGDIFIDTRQMFLAAFKRLFPYLNIKNIDLKADDGLDLPELFHQNIEKIKELLTDQKIELAQFESFLSYNKNRSLVYFGQDDLVVSKFKNYIASHVTSPEPDGNDPIDPLAAYVNPEGTKIEKTATSHAGKAAFFGAGGTGNGGNGNGSGKRIDGAAYNDQKDLVGWYR